MPIPDFQSMMLPVLKVIEGAGEASSSEIRKHIAEELEVTPEELNELLPSGLQKRFVNRVAWCLSHLKQAGLITLKSRALYEITVAGRGVVAAPPARITKSYLEQFHGYLTFRKGKTKSESGLLLTTIENEETPDERIAQAHQELNELLIAELRARIEQLDPYQFEQVVVDVLIAMGYGGGRLGAGLVTQRSSDEGIDGIINEDRLGLDVVYVQAKKWSNNVGRPDVQAFVGALAGKQASKGVMISTSDFAKSAYEYVKGLTQKVALVDGNSLAQLMIEHNVGVTVSRTFEVKRLDSDYFE